jgi:hypothetical protein
MYPCPTVRPCDFALSEIALTLDHALANSLAFYAIANNVVIL